MCRISSNIIIGGTASISGSVFLGSTASISGAVVLGSTASISGAVVLGSTASIAGALTVGGSALISGNESVTGSLYVGSGAAITGTVVLGSTASISGGLTVGGSESVGGSLVIGGAATVNSGNISITNNATTLTISPGYYGATANTSYCTFDLPGTKNFYFWDNAEVAGNLLVDSDLSVAGHLSTYPTVYSLTGTLLIVPSNVNFWSATSSITFSLSGSGLNNGFRCIFRSIGGYANIIFTAQTGYSIYNTTSSTSSSSITSNNRGAEFVYYNTGFYQMY
jgi:carbonic anhydrase/acetyltransferase-like protein (isoleucine patch superfamily)